MLFSALELISFYIDINIHVNRTKLLKSASEILKNKYVM